MHRPNLMQRGISLRGLSTIEILIAIVFLVFGLLGVLNIVDINQKSNKKAANRALAVKLAKMKAAEFQAAGYDALSKKLGKKDELTYPETLEPFDKTLKKTISKEDILRFQKFQWNATLKRAGESRIEYTVKVVWSSVRKDKSGKGDPADYPATQNITMSGFADAGGAK